MTSSNHKHASAECIYGFPCFAVCTNPNCRKPGLICEEGFYGKEQCILFHQTCSKIKWTQLQNLIHNNPNLNSPDFNYLKDKIQNMFVDVVNKVKTEHSKFKLWVKSYGYSIEVMKLIKNLTEDNYSVLNGNYIGPIVNQMCTPKKLEIPNIMESEIVQSLEDITELLDKSSELYLKPGARREKTFMSSNTSGISQQIKVAPLNSKIISDINSISRMFDGKIGALKLAFRASQNSFSIRQFHKKCDGLQNTITLIETEFGKVIGGFTPIAWSSAKKQWAADKSMKSFIFSLNMREKFSLNLAQFAIANNPDKGPIFGCCDICVVDNSNKDRSNAEFPISYNNGKYIRSPQSSFAFTGHPKGQFLVKEWEVFRVQFD